MNGKQYVDKSGMKYLVVEHYKGRDEENEPIYVYRVVNLSTAMLLDEEISVERYEPNGEFQLIELLESIEEIEIVEVLERFS